MILMREAHDALAQLRVTFVREVHGRLGPDDDARRNVRRLEPAAAVLALDGLDAPDGAALINLPKRRRARLEVSFGERVVLRRAAVEVGHDVRLQRDDDRARLPSRRRRGRERQPEDRERDARNRGERGHKSARVAAQQRVGERRVDAEDEKADRVEAAEARGLYERRLKRLRVAERVPELTYAAEPQPLARGPQRRREQKRARPPART